MRRFLVILAYAWILCLTFLSVCGLIKFDGIFDISIIMALFVVALASIYSSQGNKIRDLEMRVNKMESQLKKETPETNNLKQEEE